MALEDDPPILSSGIGGDGEKENGYCVVDDTSAMSWDLSSYWSPFEQNCLPTESVPYCCLKRSKSSTVTLTSAAQIAAFIRKTDSFATFQPTINFWHNQCHSLLATSELSHMVDGVAPDDPSFMILHAFVGYLRALWADCWDYDKIPVDELQFHEKAYSTYCGVDSPGNDDCSLYTNSLGLDDPFNTFELKDSEWSLSHSEDVTVRKLWDPTALGIVYELEPFWSNSGINKWCENQLDSDWFVQTMTGDKVREVQQRNPAIQHSLSMWDELEHTESIKEDETFDIVAAKTCDYVRRNSENSCWSEEMENAALDMVMVSDEECESLTLEEMLEMDGVRDNECLKRIRSEVFHRAEHYKSIKRKLCRGDFDYRCPQVDVMDIHDSESLLNRVGIMLPAQKMLRGDGYTILVGSLFCILLCSTICFVTWIQAYFRENKEYENLP